MKAKREDYPKCPQCGGPVVGAMMTSGSVEVDGVRYYRARAVSVYCPSAHCNYDQPLASLSAPVEGSVTH